MSILDGDKKDDAERLKDKFTQFKIIALIADDIRDKHYREIKEKNGITTEKGKIKPEFVGYSKKLISDINSAFAL